MFADFQDFVYSMSGGATMPFTATVSAATPSTLNVTGTPFAAASVFDRDGSGHGSLPGGFVEIISGKGAGQVRFISAATTSQLTVSPNWSTNPDATSVITLYQGSSGLAEVSFRPDNSSIPGNDQIISVGAWGLINGVKPSLPFIQWRTVAHELGHTLGLRHGGTDHNSQKGNNYLSLMSYSWQLNGPPSVVNSYAGATDPTYNDWANLQLDFQNAIGHVGNSLVKGDSTVVTTEPDSKEQTVLDYVNQNSANLDMSHPTVTIDAPLDGAVIPPNGTLTVTLTAADNVAVAQVTVSFDVNGDGTIDPSETVVATPAGANKYTATFTNISGPSAPRTLTATAIDSSQNATEATVTLTASNAPAASQLNVSALSASNITAGGSVTFTLTAQDSAGHDVPGYTGTVQLASSLAGIGLPAMYTFLPTDNGIHTFALTLTAAGQQTISITDQNDQALTTATAPIMVNPGTLSKFVVSALGGATLTAGNPVLVTVQAADPFGNAVSGFNEQSPLTVAVPNGSSATVPGTVSLNSAGFGYFLATFKTTGSNAITVSDAADSIISSSPSLSVAAGSAGSFQSRNVRVGGHEHFATRHGHRSGCLQQRRLRLCGYRGINEYGCRRRTRRSFGRQLHVHERRRPR